MPERPLVLLHGWSDGAASFRRLARLLAAETGRPVRAIDLADYRSMDDAITFDDLVAAMDRAWTAAKLPREPRSADLVVHSTGALVARMWLAQDPATTPVHRLLMLAPANFGSPLAHKGRAFFGRVLKGWRSAKMFQTGATLLRGLELASPLTWDLALRDRFARTRVYGPGGVLATVLVGNRGYSGISAAANEAGGDGTVRISTANLNCALLRADFSRDPLAPTFELENAHGETAFGVVAGENHSTIAGKDGGPAMPGTLELMRRALEVEDDDFPAWCRDLEERTRTAPADTPDAAPAFQNTVFVVEDQDRRRVRDYFLEFYVEDDDRGWFEEMFHGEAIRHVHVHGDEPSFRAVYVDCTRLHSQVDKDFEAMKMSLTAVPEFRRNGNVGYRTFTDEDIGGITIRRERLREIFRPDRTLLVQITLRRERAEDVFRFV